MKWNTLKPCLSSIGSGFAWSSKHYAIQLDWALMCISCHIFRFRELWKCMTVINNEHNKYIHNLYYTHECAGTNDRYAKESYTIYILIMRIWPYMDAIMWYNDSNFEQMIAQKWKYIDLEYLFLKKKQIRFTWTVLNSKITMAYAIIFRRIYLLWCTL